MEILNWLVAFIPVLSFGLIPVVATFIGGKPVNQTMGISLGALAFALVVLFVRNPEITQHIFIVGFFSGMLWAVGSVGQFQGITYLGVARATPMMNGGQVIGASLVGIFLGDWASSDAKLFGFIALALIIVGIIFTSYKEGKDVGKKVQWGKGIVINIVGILGFTAYVGLIKYFKIDSWSGIFPQSIGQIVATAIMAVVIFKMNPFTKASFKNGLVGIIWGVGNLALLLSQAKLGLATAYPISQAAVIVSIFGGVYINKEHKTKKEWIYAIAGIVVICTGLFMIYQAGTR